MTKELSAAVDDCGVWRLSGTAAGEFGLVNEFLGYLADRNFSPRTCRAYAYDLLAFSRWLAGEELGLADVNVDVLLRFLTACREATLPGRPGGNVYSIRDGRNRGYAPATSTGGWRRFRDCSHFRRCVTRICAARSGVDGRPGCGRVVNARACWRTWRSRSRGQSCGFASRGGCREDWRGRSPRRCWVVSDVGAIVRSAG